MSGDVAPVTLDQQPQQPQEADTSSAGTETAAAATSDTQPQGLRYVANLFVLCWSPLLHHE